MLFYLLVGELEYLQAVGVGGLRCLGLGEVVHDLLVRESLLDVAVVEVDDRVAVWERLSAYAIAEDHLLLAIQVCSLHFAIVANDLVLHLRVLCFLVVVNMGELHLVVLLVVVHLVSSLVIAISRHLWRLVLLVVLLLVVHFRDVGK